MTDPTHTSLIHHLAARSAAPVVHVIEGGTARERFDRALAIVEASRRPFSQRLYATESGGRGIEIIIHGEPGK